MDDIDPELDLFEKSLDWQLLPYYWHLRSSGHVVENKIEELEAKIYPEITEGRNQSVLWQRDIDELRYLLDHQEVHGEDFPGETFRILKEKEVKQFGEYRTRHLMLEALDKIAG